MFLAKNMSLSKTFVYTCRKTNQLNQKNMSKESKVKMYPKRLSFNTCVPLNSFQLKAQFTGFANYDFFIETPFACGEALFSYDIVDQDSLFLLIQSPSQGCNRGSPHLCSQKKEFHD